MLYDIMFILLRGLQCATLTRDLDVHMGRCKQSAVSLRRRCHGWVRRLYALSLQYLSSSENVTNVIHIVANGAICFSSAAWPFPSCQCNSRAGSLDAQYLSAFMLSFDTRRSTSGRNASAFCGKGTDTKVRDWHEHPRMGIGNALVSWALRIRCDCLPPFFLHAGALSFIFGSFCA